MVSIKVSVQSEPHDMKSWSALARRVESAGFEALLVGDHPGSAPSPWPALAAAAAVTSTLKLGTCMLQGGVREPIDIASDAATLDLLAPGRVIVGIGAGHTPAEWEATGRVRPNSADRVGRLKEVFDVVVRLLAGETVTRLGRYVTVRQVTSDTGPAKGVTMSIGGGNTELLRFAAQQADIISMSGLGRTRPDGHHHEIRWMRSQVQAKFDLIDAASSGHRHRPELELMVRAVEETPDRRVAAERLATRIGTIPTEDILAAPYALFGSVPQMAEQLGEQQHRWGISRYLIREPALTVMEKVLAHHL
jgi:probable F420-dependent oxidoreductase